MNDCSSGYLEFLVINVKLIITRLIDLISLLYSQSSDLGSIAGVANYNFLIIDVLTVVSLLTGRRLVSQAYY